MGLLPLRNGLESWASSFRGGAVMTIRSGLQAAALTALTLGSALVSVTAEAQPQAVVGQASGLPVTAAQVRWEDLPSPAARMATQVISREMKLPPSDVPGLQAALYALNDGQQLLLVQGGGYSGASTTGFAIFIGGPRGFREAGTVSGSRSDSIPVTLVPVPGSYPSLRAGVTQASPYNPRLSMAEQRYRVVDYVMRYDAAAGKYVDAKPRAR